MNRIKERYPRVIDCNGVAIELDLLTSLDSSEAKNFTDNLPEQDLLFLSRDIRHPRVVEAWSTQIENNEIVSVVARREGKIVGTTAVVQDKLSWSPHVGEMRILLAPDVREIGLGRVLIQESFLIGLALDLEKLQVRMLLNQTRAITILEELGFKSEALFRDHVKDSDGQKHDLLIMSHDVQAVQSMMQAYGLDEAL